MQGDGNGALDVRKERQGPQLGKCSLTVCKIVHAGWTMDDDRKSSGLTPSGANVTNSCITQPFPRPVSMSNPFYPGVSNVHSSMKNPWTQEPIAHW